MSQSSACSSSYHGAAALTVPPCDLPHIQISNTDMDDSNLGISSEEVFDPGAQMPPRNHPWYSVNLWNGKKCLTFITDFDYNSIVELFLVVSKL